MENIESNRARIPKVGEKLHFWDDGKNGDSRHYLAIVTHVLTPEQTHKVHLDLSYYKDEENPPKNLIEIQKYQAKECSWLYAKETDYFIGCAIPEYDDHIIWFVREKNGTWFSLDVQSWWQGGFLDVTGEKYENNIKEGYTYSERL